MYKYINKLYVYIYNSFFRGLGILINLLSCNKSICDEFCNILSNELKKDDLFETKS